MAKKKIKAKARVKHKKAVSKKKVVTKAKPKSLAPKMKPIPGKPASIIVAAPEKRLAGKIEHFYNNIGVAIVKLTDSDLSLGDEISIEGPHTTVKQKVVSMQLEHEKINIGRIGQIIGLKVSGRVRENDVVYKIIKKI